MTTKDILSRLPRDYTFNLVDNNIEQKYVTYRLTEKEIQALLESFGEEIIGSSDDLFEKWRVYVKEAYESKKGQMMLSYPLWLEAEQRLKVKEIISQISK